MTTTEELIANPERVVCGDDAEQTMPWHDWAMEVAEPDDAWPAAAAEPVWPTGDPDAPTELIPAVGAIEWPTEDPDEEPVRRGRHRRLTWWQRAMAWMDARWLRVILLLSTHTATGITAALAVAGGVRPLLAGAAGVGFAVWALVAWRDHHRHASPVSPVLAGRGGAR